MNTQVLKNIITCGYCSQTYKSPLMLPCFETICEEDLYDLCSGNEINCPFCKQIHKIPKTGFLVDKKINALLTINLAQLEEGLKSNNGYLISKDENRELEELESFKKIVKKPNEFVLNHFLNLKKELSTRKELAIRAVNEIYQIKLEEIEKIELKCLNRLNDCEMNNENEFVTRRKNINDLLEFFNDKKNLSTENKCNKHNQILKIIIEIDLFKNFLLHNENYWFQGNKFDFDHDFFGNLATDLNNNLNGKIIRQTKTVRFQDNDQKQIKKEENHLNIKDDNNNETDQEQDNVANLEKNEKFNESNLKIELIDGIKSYGLRRNFNYETKQNLFKGQDLVINSKNCLEKYFLTSVFILQKIDIALSGCQAIILTYFDDQAIQIEETIKTVGKYIPFKSNLFIGKGQYTQDDLKNICGENHIWIASLDRLKDFADTGFMDFKNVRTVVTFGGLKFFNYQNLRKYDNILSNIDNKSSLQQIFFSVSNQYIDKFVSKMKEPTQLILKLKENVLRGVQFFYYEVEREQKLKAIFRIKKELPSTKLIIYCNEDSDIDYIESHCDPRNLKYITISSKVGISKRESLLHKFKSNSYYDALFVTDSFSYTGELKEFKIIINYDLPYDFEHFLNRILRGDYLDEHRIPTIVSLVSNVQKYLIAEIEKIFKIKFGHCRL